VERDPFVAHSYSREDGLVIVAITLRDYPITVVRRLLAAAAQKYPDGRWMLDRVDNKKPCLEYTELIKRYQDPIQADPIKRVQAKIEEVKASALITMDKLLARGDTIEVLVARSDDLSASSKKFYDHSDDLNSCCWRYFGRKRRSDK